MRRVWGPLEQAEGHLGEIGRRAVLYETQHLYRKTAGSPPCTNNVDREFLCLLLASPLFPAHNDASRVLNKHIRPLHNSANQGSPWPPLPKGPNLWARHRNVMFMYRVSPAHSLSTRLHCNPLL
jgi:hypothetical protein